MKELTAKFTINGEHVRAKVEPRMKFLPIVCGARSVSLARMSAASTASAAPAR